MGLKKTIKRRTYDAIQGAIVGTYEGWIIEAAMRYMPMVRLLRQSECVAPVVEIGSGVSGIAPYLQAPVIGVDMGFDQVTHPLLQPIEGSALALPFGDSSQSCVISTDMLEHIPADLRQAAVDELVRIASRMLILAVPAGPGAEAQDRLLATLFVEERGVEFPFLTEHVENGLPTEEEFHSLIAGSLDRSGKSAEVEFARNSNLWVRERLMRLWIKSERPGPLWTWRALNHLHPILSRMNFGECYRAVAIVRFDRSS